MAYILPTKNTASPIILFAIIALGFFAGYFYYSQTSTEPMPQALPAANIADNLSKFKDLKLDFSGLDNLTFKALKIFGESPVQPGSTGRIDIFAPF